MAGISSQISVCDLISGATGMTAPNEEGGIGFDWSMSSREGQEI